jgi:hypothetical protein
MRHMFKIDGMIKQSPHDPLIMDMNIFLELSLKLTEA